MSSLKNLPFDVFILIFKFRNILINRSVVKIQATWKYYRIKLLMERFKLLYYIPIFKRFNPDIITFLERSKL